MAHIIVVGNEKGGAGKSTVSMHLATALARMGYGIGVIDLDLRQRSLARYIENRAKHAEDIQVPLPIPRVQEIPVLEAVGATPGDQELDQGLSHAIAALEYDCDYILLDCPGSHTRLSQVAHSLADTLLTPLNDSFVDFDMLGRIDSDGETILGPSVYSEMVWSARQMRAQAGLPAIDWIVLRNRVGAQQMVNKKKVENALNRLAKRIGFRVAPGFTERVVFRELFPKGLTLLDLRDAGIRQLDISKVAARQELRDLFAAVKLPGVEVSF